MPFDGLTHRLGASGSIHGLMHGKGSTWGATQALQNIRSQPPKDYCFFAESLQICPRAPAIQNKEWGSWILMGLSLKLFTAGPSNPEDALNLHPSGHVLVPCPVLYCPVAGKPGVSSFLSPFHVKGRTAPAGIRFIMLEFMLFMPHPWLKLGLETHTRAQPSGSALPRGPAGVGLGGVNSWP